MAITYEWVAEEYDENGDIIDPMFGETLNEVLGFLPPAPNVKYALTKNIGDRWEGLQDRQYAYVTVFGLPVEFDDGYKVPARYHREVLFKRNQKLLNA